MRGSGREPRSGKSNEQQRRPPIERPSRIITQSKKPEARRPYPHRHNSNVEGDGRKPTGSREASGRGLESAEEEAQKENLMNVDMTDDKWHEKTRITGDKDPRRHTAKGVGQEKAKEE